MDSNSPQPPKEKKKGLYIGPVNLTRLEKRLLFIMNKDSIHLLRAVNEGQLEKNSQDALRGYVKLVKELNSRSERVAEEISEEELLKKLKD